MANISNTFPLSSFSFAAKLRAGLDGPISNLLIAASEHICRANGGHARAFASHEAGGNYGVVEEETLAALKSIDHAIVDLMAARRRIISEMPAEPEEEA